LALGIHNSALDKGMLTLTKIIGKFGENDRNILEKKIRHFLMSFVSAEIGERRFRVELSPRMY